MYADTLLDIAMTHADVLIEQARQGEEKARNQLVSLWFKRIYNFAYKYFDDHDLAMEVAQRTFITMDNKIKGLTDIGAFKSWLYRIALNYCHDELRSTYRREARMRPMQPSDQQQQSSMPGPQVTIEQKELAEHLQLALNELSKEQREVLLMKEFEGLKFREIANVLEVSENTVKSRLYYALGHLRKILSERNITLKTLQL